MFFHWKQEFFVDHFSRCLFKGGTTRCCSLGDFAAGKDIETCLYKSRMVSFDMLQSMVVTHMITYLMIRTTAQALISYRATKSKKVSIFHGTLPSSAQVFIPFSVITAVSKSNNVHWCLGSPGIVLSNNIGTFI